MLVNAAALQGIYKSFNTLFNEAYSGAKPKYEKIATKVISAGKSEEYGWLGSFPRLRQWVGERVIKSLKAHNYTIKNLPFEATVEVSREDIEDDTYGVYRPIVSELGRSAAIHPDELVFELLAKGFTTTCYDGQYFFDTDHPGVNGKSQSNKGTATLSPASYSAARAQAMSLTDDEGKSLGIVPNLLVVPPQLEETARRILNADIINNETNVLKGSAELLVVPEVAGNPTGWFLLDVSRGIKPFIFQVRKNYEFVALDKITDINVFMNKQFIYGVDARCNVGFGLWQLAYGSTGTGN